MMPFEELKERIKEHEGYRLDVYKCSEGFDTGGYGPAMHEHPKCRGWW